MLYSSVEDPYYAAHNIKLYRYYKLWCFGGETQQNKHIEQYLGNLQKWQEFFYCILK